MDKETKLIILVNLQAELIKCLHSVLSEWEQDKSCYLQWGMAQSLEHVIELINLNREVD